MNSPFIMHKYRGTELKMCRQLSFWQSTILNVFCSVDLFQEREKGTTVSCLIPICFFSKAIRNSIKTNYKYPPDPISFPLGCVKYWPCSVPVKWPCCLIIIGAKGRRLQKHCHHRWRYVIYRAVKKTGVCDMAHVYSWERGKWDRRREGNVLYSILCMP